MLTDLRLALRTLRIEPDTKIYCTPNDQLTLTYLSGLPVQSIAPVRRTFLNTYPGPVLIIDSAVPLELVLPEELIEIAAEAGQPLTWSEAQRLAGPAARSPMMRPVMRMPAIAFLCGLPLLLLAALVATGTLDVLSVLAPSNRGAPAAELGIGEFEMGRDFGRPTMMPERGPVATALLSGLLLLCPAKFVLLWALQRQESRQMCVPTPGKP